MKTLTIRQVPDDVHESVRIRAAEKGRSMEEHVRQLLAEDAARRSKRVEPGAALRELQDHVRGLFDGALPGNVVDDFLNEKRKDAQREWLKDAP